MTEFSGEKLACEETFLLLYTLQKWKFKGKQKFLGSFNCVIGKGKVELSVY